MNGREIQTAIRVDRPSLQWMAFPFCSPHLFLYSAGLNDASTLHGERRVSARWGWEGETSDFFTRILNGCLVMTWPTDKRVSFRYLFLFIMTRQSDRTMTWTTRHWNSYGG